MDGSDGVVGVTARDQVLVEVSARGNVVFALFAGLIELEDGNADGAVRAELYGLVEEGAEALRVAVGGEAHDFVFVGVEVEAKVERDERVEDSDGVVGTDGADAFDFAVVEVVDAEAFDLAHGVVYDDEALIPTGGESGAGGVGHVVADGEDLGCGKAGKIAGNLGKKGFAGEDVAIEPGGDFVGGVEVAEGRVVKAVGDLINVVDGDAGLSEAEVDGVDGKVAGVLLCGESFLFGGSDKLAIDDESCSRVHALGDAILALFKAGEVSPLERHGVLKSTDSQDLHSLPRMAPEAKEKGTLIALQSRSDD